MKDSGTRRNFFTGAVRDGAVDKPRPDLISPFALMRVGEWMRKGAEKYSERNWEKGMPFTIFYESLFRHLLKFGMGMDDEDHLAAIIFNAQAIMHFQETGRIGLDNMPYRPLPKLDEAAKEAIKQELLTEVVPKESIQPEAEKTQVLYETETPFKQAAGLFKQLFTQK